MTERLEHDWFPRPLPPNVVIGERSWLYSTYAFRHYRSRRPRGVHIGADTGIYHGTFFDLGPRGEVEIGDYCTIVGAIFATNQRITIDDYTFVAHEVVVADHFVARPPEPLTNDDEPIQSVAPITIRIGPNAWIGARAILLAGARIGEGAIVGAGAVVDFDVAPFTIVAGNPARLVGLVHPIQEGARPQVVPHRREIDRE
jgi:acetyltransferase-like isoleucine patch superfamily enzyme